MDHIKKTLLLDMANELYQANETYGKGSKNVADMQVRLAQCQETAITLGNALEARGSCGERLMHILEDYCEAIYQMGVNSQDDIICGELSNQIRWQLLQVKNGIIHDLPADKKEIAFFPYKAAMWDCLESFWMAAKEDENCEVYVVPIPYFDKNQDGTIRQWHYEGAEYPDYVPIVPWEEYDIGKRQPDVVFIHNPYDGCNYVTSVHPAFYSSELKKCTDMLVYVPYFVALRDVEEHFCTAPAIFHADRIIVQSERVRDTYIRVYMEQAGEKQRETEKRTGRILQGYWQNLKQAAEKKFVIKPSSKIERVLRASQEEAVILDEWKPLLLDAAGGRKKAILYNTTIEAVLKHRDSYMQKVAAVLQFFRKNQEVVLWWRPHPLLQSTLEAIAPQLSQVYRRIVERYRGEGWGIYDDTPDITRAVVATDAYYGDWSSVVALYQETGKPIMIQDVEIITDS